jgi:hypothetical protein
MAQTRVISVSVLLGEAISRIHTGGSVGALFGAALQKRFAPACVPYNQLMDPPEVAHAVLD